MWERPVPPALHCPALWESFWVDLPRSLPQGVRVCLVCTVSAKCTFYTIIWTSWSFADWVQVIRESSLSQLLSWGCGSLRRKEPYLIPGLCPWRPVPLCTPPALGLCHRMISGRNASFSSPRKEVFPTTLGCGGMLWVVETMDLGVGVRGQPGLNQSIPLPSRSRDGDISLLCI